MVRQTDNSYYVSWDKSGDKTATMTCLPATSHADGCNAWRCELHLLSSESLHTPPWVPGTPLPHHPPLAPPPSTFSAAPLLTWACSGTPGKDLGMGQELTFWFPFSAQPSRAPTYSLDNYILLDNDLPLTVVTIWTLHTHFKAVKLPCLLLF